MVLPVSLLWLLLQLFVRPERREELADSSQVVSSDHTSFCV